MVKCLSVLIEDDNAKIAGFRFRVSYWMIYRVKINEKACIITPYFGNILS